MRRTFYIQVYKCTRLPFFTDKWFNCSIQLQINKNYMLILDPGVHIENPLLSTCSGSLPNNQTGPPAPHTLSHIISNYMPYKEATALHVRALKRSIEKIFPLKLVRWSIKFDDYNQLVWLVNKSPTIVQYVPIRI